jgi:hypothetical protein
MSSQPVGTIKRTRWIQSAQGLKVLSFLPESSVNAIHVHPFAPQLSKPNHVSHPALFRLSEHPLHQSDAYLWLQAARLTCCLLVINNDWTIIKQA